MVNVNPGRDPARGAPRPTGPTAHAAVAPTALIAPEETLRRALRDLDTAGRGLAGEAATLVRSAADEVRSALAARRENGDVGAEPADASLRADLQRTQEQHGPDGEIAAEHRAPHPPTL